MDEGPLYNKNSTPTTPSTPASASTHNYKGVNINVGYLKSVPGYLKFAELALCIICVICANIGYHVTGLLTFVSVSALFFTLVLLALHALNIFPKQPPLIVHPFVVFIYYSIDTALFLIAGIICTTSVGYSGANGAAAFFAFASALVYGYDTYRLFLAWRGYIPHHSGTGGVTGTVVEQQTTTTTTTTTRTGDLIQTNWDQQQY